MVSLFSVVVCLVPEVVSSHFSGKAELMLSLSFLLQYIIGLILYAVPV